MKCCKYLGLDYGDKNIGVSVSVNGRVATGVTTLRRKDAVAIRASLMELKSIIREYGITHIVLGNPINMDGEESERCKVTLDFKEKLSRFFKSVTVVLWDERLSTRAVTRVHRRKRKNVDEMAAVYILQGYLDYENGKESDDLDDNALVSISGDGEEHPLHILASHEDETGIYVLATEDDDEVYLFKVLVEDEDEDEVIFEQINEEHADYNRVFGLFDFDELGIDLG